MSLCLRSLASCARPTKASLPLLVSAPRTAPPSWRARRGIRSAVVGNSMALSMGVLSADTAPPLADLKNRINSTPTAQELQEIEKLWEKGEGPPHTDCKLRLFGRSEDEVKVTLYRDTAAWCPYCQKVWMMFEEKQIPYRIVKINMRSYGDKPQWFLQKIPSGLLPVVEINGEMITESLVIMQLLESNFDGPELCPKPGTPGFEEANALLKLERQLFGAWCSLVFRPGPGVLGGIMGGGPRKAFEATLDKVEEALSKHPESPWLVGGERPSIVDLQYISHVERMLASCMYWKGMQLRNTERYPFLEQWLDAFEQRPSYQATKSDYYTHVRDIPPQYGPGFADETPEVAAATKAISGGSWQLPLELRASDVVEPLSPHMDRGDEAARHEAVYKTLRNLEAIVKFCCRAAGQPGSKRFGAQLADPYAEPDMNWAPEVDVMLRHIAAVMISGEAPSAESAKALRNDLVPGASKDDRKQLASCLAYLRDRVGVPRDMSFAAAMQLRAHLNWAIDVITA